MTDDGGRRTDVGGRRGGGEGPRITRINTNEKGWVSIRVHSCDSWARSRGVRLERIRVRPKKGRNESQVARRCGRSSALEHQRRSLKAGQSRLLALEPSHARGGYGRHARERIALNPLCLFAATGPAACRSRQRAAKRRKRRKKGDGGGRMTEDGGRRTDVGGRRGGGEDPRITRINTNEKGWVSIRVHSCDSWARSRGVRLGEDGRRRAEGGPFDDAYSTSMDDFGSELFSKAPSEAWSQQGRRRKAEGGGRRSSREGTQRGGAATKHPERRWPRKRRKRRKKTARENSSRRTMILQYSSAGGARKRMLALRLDARF